MLANDPICSSHKVLLQVIPGTQSHSPQQDTRLAEEKRKKYGFRLEKYEASSELSSKLIKFAFT